MAKNEHSVIAKTPDEARAAMRKIHLELGNIPVMIGGRYNVLAGDDELLPESALRDFGENIEITPMYEAG